MILKTIPIIIATVERKLYSFILTSNELKLDFLQCFIIIKNVKYKAKRNSDLSIIGVSFLIQIFISLFQRKIFRNYTRSDLLHILIKYTAKPPLIIQDTLF